MTLINYYKETIRFVNSLVIKIDEIRIHQNYHTYVKYGKTPPDLLNSKYYQNISGTLNLNDIPVIIKNNEQLTRNYILNNVYYKKELTKYGDTYNKLILNNPGMSDYIRGCLLDISIEEFIDLDNYTVVSYKKELLSDNEHEIIVDIENFVYKIMTNYNNRKYMADELYLPALISNLYSSLVLFIISKRFGNIKTNRVDSFHLEKHLMSYKYLYKDSKFFDLSTNIYLYGNITRLKHTLGRNKVLEEYMTDVYSKNDIGIGLLKMQRKRPLLITDNISNIEEEFYKKEYVIKADPVNDVLYNIKGKEFTLEEINKLLLNNDIGNINKNSYIARLNKELELNNSITKGNLFILDKPEKIAINENNNFIFLLSNLINLFNENKLNYTFTLDYTNIRNFKIYKLTANDILNIILINLYNIYNISSDTFDIKCSNVFINNDKHINKNSILQKTWYKEDISPIYDYITKDVNLYLYITNIESLQYYLTAVRAMDSKVWFTKSNIVDNIGKTDISIISKHILIDKILNFNIDNIKNEMYNNGLDDFTNDFGFDILIDILEKTSNFNVDESKLIKEKMIHVQSFFNKTTSYTIDLVIDENFNSGIMTNGGDMGINLGYKPMMQVNNTTYQLYEELDIVVNTYDYVDNVLNIYNPNNSAIDVNGYYRGLPLMMNGNDFTEPVITSKSKRLYGNKYSPKLSIKNFNDNSINTVNEEESSFIRISNGGKVGNIKVIPNDVMEDGVDITILNK